MTVIADVPLMPPIVATSWAVPGPVAVPRPAAFTLTTEAFVVDQLIVAPLITAPDELYAVALNCAD
jgi:hypothetical protein